MRIIIEVEGRDGAPEVVLRSTQQTGALLPSPTAVSPSGAIDAGPAPSAEGATTEGQMQITTPVAPTSLNVGSAQSAGAAPSPSSG